MKSIKNTFLVSALSLGIIVSAVGVAGAATSTDYQQKFAEWINPNPIVMNTNPVAAPAIAPAATPVAAPAMASTTTPVAAPAVAPANKPVAVPAKAATAAPQPIQYHYNDGHSGMNPQQHQQMHNNVNGNGHDNNANHNSMGEGHMGSQFGHE